MATPSTSIEEQQNLYLGSDNVYHDYGRNIETDQDAQAQNEVAPHHNGDGQDRDIGIRHGDSYEIALDVLMTLGTGDPGVDTPTPAAPVLGDIEEINLSSPPSILKSIDDLGPISVQVANQLSQGRTIELLRHYRYKIAPWVRKGSFIYRLQQDSNNSLISSSICVIWGRLLVSLFHILQ